MQRYLDYGSLPGGRTRVKNWEVGSGDGGGGGLCFVLLVDKAWPFGADMPAIDLDSSALTYFY